MMMSDILPLVSPNDARYKPVEFNFEDPIQDPVELADQLWKNMVHYNGVGLSANQVGINASVFVIKCRQIICIAVLVFPAPVGR